MNGVFLAPQALILLFLCNISPSNGLSAGDDLEIVMGEERRHGAAGVEVDVTP
jgi:hypothetical protein